MNKHPAKSFGKAHVPSVEKALNVVNYLAGVKDGATMKDMVEGLGHSMGKLYRVVVHLAESGYLDFDKSTGRYSLSLKLFEISHRHDPTEELIGKAVPLMERFSALTEQSCHLGVLNRAHILVLASTASPRPAGYSVRTGALFSAQDTSTGAVIAAFSDPQQQERYLNRLPANERDALRRRFDSIRNTGCERRESAIVAGVLNLSVPIFNIRGIVAALTCGYIIQTPQETDADETLRILSDIADGLSRSLGHSAEGET